MFGGIQNLRLRSGQIPLKRRFGSTSGIGWEIFLPISQIGFDIEYRFFICPIQTKFSVLLTRWESRRNSKKNSSQNVSKEFFQLGRELDEKDFFG